MSVDLIKRRDIMEKSRNLGHCICDPKKSCPCDIFKEKNICLCAGERLETVDISKVRLTQHVHNAGCASKISPVDLERVLGRLPPVDDPRVLSGISSGDDAGIFKISEELIIVQTVDVFTPCVDDPYTFGQIAASNSVSDIYAMGGKPLTALSILAFPTDTLPEEVMYQMMKGGLDKLKEAGVVTIGGHSIKDNEIKFGFAITGVIAKDKIVTRQNIKPGDSLILTKPIGTGVISFAAQIGRASKEAMVTIGRSMTQLNEKASQIMQEAGASGCTDITGFGLFGHLIRMAKQSRITVNIFAESIPVFDEALYLVRQGVITGAMERNREYVDKGLVVNEDVDPGIVNLGFDAQTAGGLLIAADRNKAAKIIESLKKNGIEASLIGEVLEHSEGKIMLLDRDSCLARNPDLKNDFKNAEPQPADCCAGESGQKESDIPCCDQSKAGNFEETKSKFQEFMKAAGKSGAVDSKQKELIMYALAVLSKCEPCIELHYKKAINMGITPEEIEECAWMAVAMGGAPVLAFYNKIRNNGL